MSEEMGSTANSETPQKYIETAGTQNKTQKTFGAPRIFLLFFRTTLFFFFFSMAQVIFFFIGNYQQFTDENQVLILSVGAVSSVLLVIFSLFTLAISVFYTVKSRSAGHRAKHIANILFMIFFIAVGTAFLIVASTLVFFAE